MKFVLQTVVSKGVRVGKVVADKNGKDVVMQTPSCLSHTRMGHFPCLTPDLIKKIPHRPNGVLLSSSTMYEQPGAAVLSTYSKGIHKFLNLEDSIIYLSVQDPASPPLASYNQEKSVSIWRRTGRKKLTVTDHMSLVESFKPDMFEPLCDTASSTGNKAKRIKKSVDRTLSFLDETLEIKDGSGNSGSSVLGVIEGSDNLEERLRSAKETAIRPVNGFVFEGYQLPFEEECLGRVLSSVVELLPLEKPRLLVGLHEPRDIFIALENGIDIFDSSFAAVATEKGHALAYNIGSGVVELSEKKQTMKQLTRAEADLDAPNGVIDLNCVKFSSDFRPLVNGCGCYTCVTFTRAYIHHLLVTKEIMGGMLLTIQYPSGAIDTPSGTAILKKGLVRTLTQFFTHFQLLPLSSFFSGPFLVQ